MRVAADIARVDARRVTVKGRVETPSSRLLVAEVGRPSPGSYFVAQGELFAGGFSISLAAEGQSPARISVEKRGKFLAVIEPEGDGPFQLVIANHVGGVRPRNDFSISRIGWVQMPGPLP